MFRDARQTAKVCMALFPNPEYWTLDGPTEAAVKAREDLPFSSGEALMFAAAWAVWSPSQALPFDLGRALHVLDGHNLRRLGGLLLALAGGSSQAVDVWLAEWEKRS